MDQNKNNCVNRRRRGDKMATAACKVVPICVCRFEEEDHQKESALVY